MMIRIRNIPEDGVDLDFAIPASLVRSSFVQGDQTVNLFKNQIICSIHLNANKKDVYLRGNAKTTIEPICSRCGEIFSHPLSLNMSLTCQPAEKKKINSYLESDEGLVFYNHDELDLSEIVREQLLLSLPIQTICQPNCLGLCPECGANLNQGDHACLQKRAKH